MMESSLLMAQIKRFMYQRRYVKRIIEPYVTWIRRPITFHGKHHPEYMGVEQVEVFLNYLALERHVTAGTQALALNAVPKIICGSQWRQRFKPVSTYPPALRSSEHAVIWQRFTFDGDYSVKGAR